MVFKNIEYMNGGCFENLSGTYKKVLNWEISLILKRYLYNFTTSFIFQINSKRACHRFYHSNEKTNISSETEICIIPCTNKYISGASITNTLYMKRHIKTDGEIIRQLLLSVMLTDLLFYCSIRSCKLSTKVTPLHAHRDTFFWAHVGLLAKNASKFQMLKCILDEFSIHTHLSWHTGNVIDMKRFGKIVWRQRLKNLEIHWRSVWGYRET